MPFMHMSKLVSDRPILANSQVRTYQARPVLVGAPTAARNGIGNMASTLLGTAVV